MWIAILLLAAALLFVLVKWLVLRRETTAMAASVREISPGKGGGRLRVNSQDKAVLELANAVNALYDQADEMRAEHRRAADELRQNMEDVSHDLRTPLTSILGYLRLLEKPDTTPAQRLEYLAIATRKAEALRRMVDGLFELARLEAENHRFDIRPLDGAQLLAEEMAAFYTAFTGAGIQPVVALPHAPLPILADRQALQRVFGNLLQNIVKHSDPAVEITAHGENGRAVFLFANDAPKLTVEKTEKIFQRSFTGDKARNSQNTGLGLAIARQLVLQMGGEISATLEEGRLGIRLSWPLLPQ